MKNKDLAILIYSCWKNSDMWDVFGRLFKKYWNNCPYKVVLLTDKCEGRQENDIFDEVVICDGSWYQMLMKGFDVVDTRYVMLWMDDYLLCDYIDTKDIEYYLDKAKLFHAANIRLVESDMIKSRIYEKDIELNYYQPGTAYSFSTQVGIWDVEFLRKNINPQWSAWDFERKGSIEVKDYESPLLASKNYTFPYEEGVRRGKWMDNGIRLCRRNNIKLDFEKRPRMSNFELAWIYFKGGLLEINPTLVVKIQNFLSKR